MIFTQEHINLILSHRKTQTRRVCKPTESLVTSALHPYVATDSTVKWQVGRAYAIQPGRGAKAVGRIEIVAIRQEKLQNISYEDVMREGYPADDAHHHGEKYYRAYNQFVEAWDSINKRKGTRWQDNPP